MAEGKPKIKRCGEGSKKKNVVRGWVIPKKICGGGSQMEQPSICNIELFHLTSWWVSENMQGGPTRNMRGWAHKIKMCEGDQRGKKCGEGSAKRKKYVYPQDLKWNSPKTVQVSQRENIKRLISK